MTERYRRRDFGHMDIEVTFTDPAVYARPITVALRADLQPDTELLEAVCNEGGDKNLEHWVGKASDEKKSDVEVAPGILAKYVGTSWNRISGDRDPTPERSRSPSLTARCSRNSATGEKRSSRRSRTQPSAAFSDGASRSSPTARARRRISSRCTYQATTDTRRSRRAVASGRKRHIDTRLIDVRQSRAWRF